MISKKRIESIDILRGFTICAMILVNTPGTWSSVYKPLLHASWHGLTPTDLVFPFFLFIVGVSIYFAYKSKKQTKETYKKITIRSLKLFGLGVFINIFVPYLPFIQDLETLRIPGVLQRIGIVFFISSVIYLNFNWKIIIGIILIILASYWLFTGFVPLPNGSLPTFDRATNNWANFIDVTFLKNHLWQPDYDPEGILSTIPSIASCLIGVIIGRILEQLKNFRSLIYISIVFLVSGYLFSTIFPINKAIWSSSFVLVTSGWATLFLSLIYYLTDEKQLKFGSIFKYVGLNAITIYFLSSVISKSFYLIKVSETNNIHSFIFNEIFSRLISNNNLASLLYAISVVVFYMIFAYYLFKKKVFIKV